MPAFQAFKDADHFYGTAFHELVHWCGHKSRLDRDLKKRFAAEELIAELGAAFLCAEFGFDGDLRHASYLHRDPDRSLEGRQTSLLHGLQPSLQGGSPSLQGGGLPARQGVGRADGRSCVRRCDVPFRPST
jgi:Zincin-like metallopeptidase